MFEVNFKSEKYNRIFNNLLLKCFKVWDIKT